MDNTNCRHLSWVYARTLLLNITLLKTFTNHTSEFAASFWLPSIWESTITTSSRSNDPYWLFPVMATILAWSTVSRTKCSSQIRASIGMTLTDWMTPRDFSKKPSFYLFPCPTFSDAFVDRGRGSWWWVLPELESQCWPKLLPPNAESGSSTCQRRPSHPNMHHGKVLFKMAKFHALSAIFINKINTLCSQCGSDSKHEASHWFKSKLDSSRLTDWPATSVEMTTAKKK